MTRGLRYYAYLDDYDSYINEFDTKVDKYGEPIVCNTDEFGKTFIDYVTDYSAKNAVRYLYDVYKIKTCGYFDGAIFVYMGEKKHMLPLKIDRTIAFARLVATMGDAELFFNIFDSYKMFFSNGHYGGPKSLFNNDEFIRVLLDNEHLFSALFEIRHYEYECPQRKWEDRPKKVISADIPNPILNNCLKYSLEHLDKYRLEAKRILKFGIEYNTNLIKKYPKGEKLYESKYMCVDELGAIRDGFSSDFLTMAIIAYGVRVDDREIQNLIDKLPKYPKYYE